MIALILITFRDYSALCRGAEHYDEGDVCYDISVITCPNLSIFSVPMAMAWSSLCTSIFTHDFMFAYNWPGKGSFN